jgi:glycine hydroxymethyltransferase
MIPGDKNSPFVTSGLRLGTPALTSRGMKATEMKRIGQMIVERLQQPTSAAVKEKIAGEVKELCRHFPLYAQSGI